MPWMQVPSIYAEGYERAKSIDRSLADSYIAHTQLGDPLADAAIADLADLSRNEAARLVGGAIEQDDRVLCDAPESLRELIHEATVVPAWYDRAVAQRGCRAFLGSSDHILAAFVAGAIVEGFSTMISKSFAVTGRLVDDGVRRLKQNVRQLLEIFMPRGIEPSGDGWKLTLRIRIVHAQVRSLLAESEAWNRDAWGVPISAAHLALASAAFSARLLDYAAMLGAVLDDDDRAGIMHVWSCTARLMGVPDQLLFRDHAEGLRLFRLGAACEPPPDQDAIAMAHCVIDSAPLMIGIRDPVGRSATARHIYRVSRELLGDPLAETLRFPPRRALPILPWLRTKAALWRGMGRVFPPLGRARSAAAFLHVLGLADMGEARIRYELPDHARSGHSSRW